MLVLKRKLLRRVSNGSSLNSLSNYNSSVRVVSNNCSFFCNLNSYSVSVLSLGSLVATARYECYAEKNSKRVSYFLHFRVNLNNKTMFAIKNDAKVI